MSAGQGYHGRHRHDDGPQADTTMMALSDAALALAKAAIAAETAQAQQTDDLLTDAEMIAFGFEPGSDEAMGLTLLIAAIGRARDEAAS
jgi:hypothetical protein